jgi:hypothetical protein
MHIELDCYAYHNIRFYQIGRYICSISMHIRLDCTAKICYTLRREEIEMYQSVIQDKIIIISPTGEIICLQDVATDIWKLYQDGASREEIEQSLAQMYDADPQQIKMDIAEFMMIVIAKGLDKEEHARPAQIMTWLLRLPLPTTLKAYIILRRIQQQLSTHGFFAIARELANIPARRIVHATSNDVQRRAQAIARAATYLHSKPECLQQYLSLCFLLRLKKIDATIEIGITLYPFASHAWASSNGQPIAWKTGMGMDKSLSRLKDYHTIFTSKECRDAGDV